MERKSQAKKVSFMGLLLALALTLSFVEMSIAPLLAMPPGVKLGLANVVGMYALFSFGAKEAVLLTILRSTFVLLVRGVTSFMMSLSGGLCSIFLLILLVKVLKGKPNYTMLSMLGAVTHNMAQLVTMTLILKTPVFYYGPILLISGVLVGYGTGVVLKAVMPALQNIQNKMK